MRSLRTLVLAAAVLGATAAQASATEYTLDTAHTNVGFEVRHLLTKVHGRFNKFDGSFTYDPKDLKSASGKIVIETTSVDTNVEKRDNHLRSADFFEVAKYPTMTFVIKSAQQKGTEIELTGDLTIKGVTKPVVLTAEYNGEAADPWGNKSIGFTATGKINRKDYGLTWNKTTETGGLLVGDDITLVIDVEAKPKVAAK